MKFCDSASFHEFRFNSEIPRIPRVFRDRGKSLSLIVILVVIWSWSLNVYLLQHKAYTCCVAVCPVQTRTLWCDWWVEQHTGLLVKGLSAWQAGLSFCMFSESCHDLLSDKIDNTDKMNLKLYYDLNWPILEIFYSRHLLGCYCDPDYVCYLL